MSDQPSPAFAQGPRSPVQGTWPLAAQGPIDPAGGDAVANPLPSDPTVIATGRALYAIYCVPCHGTSGSGSDGPVAAYFPRVGNLASPDTQKHGDGWLYAIITTGTETMPSYAHELNARERWQIVRFVRTLSR
jgi:mono/diheme cytochrome c family protein